MLLYLIEIEMKPVVTIFRVKTSNTGCFPPQILSLPIFFENSDYGFHIFKNICSWELSFYA